MSQLSAPAIIITISAAMFSGVTTASENWSYVGQHGPSHWGEQSHAWRQCSEGRNQSPIDIRSTVKASLPPLALSYKQGGQQVLHNGHTLQVTFQGGSTLTLDGTVFELKQLHFHAPSENQIEGKSYPLEAHLVHADQNGNLTVLAVMFEQGNANPVLAAPWAIMPSAHQQAPLSPALNALTMLPADRSYYRFNGSLTTPPCSEGVRWLVLKQPVQASRQQLDQFRAAMGGDTNRPVQALFARQVLE